MAFTMDLVPMFVSRERKVPLSEGQMGMLFIVSTAGCQPSGWSALPTVERGVGWKPAT